MTIDWETLVAGARRHGPGYAWTGGRPWDPAGRFVPPPRAAAGGAPPLTAREMVEAMRGWEDDAARRHPDEAA